MPGVRRRALSAGLHQSWAAVMCNLVSGRRRTGAVLGEGCTVEPSNPPITTPIEAS